MAVGQTFFIANAYGYWAPNDGTVPLPGRHVPYAKPTASLIPGLGWEPIMDTVNGYIITPTNPRVAITSEERGEIGRVSGGGEGVSVGQQFRSLSFDLWKKIAAQQSRTKAASTQATVLTISGTATGGGTYNINPGGLTPVPIAIASSDTAAAAATKVAAGTYTGYTAVAAGAVVTFTATSSGYKGEPSITGTVAGLTATFGTGGRGGSETEISELDKAVDMGLMLCIDGQVAAGSLFTERRWVRFIAYNAENTANSDGAFRHDGADAVFSPSATFQCLPAVEYDSGLFTANDFTSADLDPNRRQNYFWISAPETP